MYKTRIFLLFLFPIVTYGMNQFDAKKFDKPVREVSVIATDDGYYPNKISAFEGERIRFYVTSTSKQKQCFLMENHKIFLPAENGQVADKTIVVERPGRFKFYCPSTKFVGHLTVLKKKEEKSEEIKRKLAGDEEKKPHYWVPRDYDEM